MTPKYQAYAHQLEPKSSIRNRDCAQQMESIFSRWFTVPNGKQSQVICPVLMMKCINGCGCWILCVLACFGDTTPTNEEKNRMMLKLKACFAFHFIWMCQKNATHHFCWRTLTRFAKQLDSFRWYELQVSKYINGSFQKNMIFSNTQWLFVGWNPLRNYPAALNLKSQNLKIKRDQWKTPILIFDSTWKLLRWFRNV